jgi:hypothetical protein
MALLTAWLFGGPQGHGKREVATIVCGTGLWSPRGLARHTSKAVVLMATSSRVRSKYKGGSEVGPTGLQMEVDAKTGEGSITRG